ncbi:MAG: tRNA pseudouridine(38-40) synthase TruA [Pirellulales bacterium]
MRSVKLTLAYDGTNYSGWQTQPDRVTLQQTLERALRHVVGEDIRVVASGRTDAGVHALGQVVSFQTDSRLEPEILQKALNSELPHDMAVIEAALAPAGFHAIAGARRKRYRYVLDDGAIRDVFQRDYAWHRYCRLDEKSMRRAAQALVGTHDFASFQTAGSERQTTVRTVFEIVVARGQGGAAGLPYRSRGTGGLATRGAAGELDAGDFITVDIEADGFLYNMVRVIVGTLVEVGQGKRDEAWPALVLEARNRQAAGRTAPAQGLFLVRVEY